MRGGLWSLYFKDAVIADEPVARTATSVSNHRVRNKPTSCTSTFLCELVDGSGLRLSVNSVPGIAASQ